MSVIVIIVNQLIALVITIRFGVLFMVTTVYILKPPTLVNLLNIVHVCSIKGVTKVVRILSHLRVHTSAE